MPAVSKVDISHNISCHYTPTPCNKIKHGTLFVAIETHLLHCANEAPSTTEEKKNTPFFNKHIKWNNKPIRKQVTIAFVHHPQHRVTGIIADLMVELATVRNGALSHDTFK